jgi:glucose/arabinose dehydrogenase
VVNSSITDDSKDIGVELVAEGFSFPTSLTFDSTGAAFIAEAGLPFGGAKPGGHIWHLKGDGNHTLLVQDLHPPVTGLTFRDGALYVSEGGHPARISRLDLDGRLTVIVDRLPGPGNYHTNMVAFGPDGKLYFSQGAMTNTGIVGLDAYELGWLRRLPHAHDIPGYDITLAGVNCETTNPLGKERNAKTLTGAFAPFGTPTYSAKRIHGEVPCTAAVMRCNSDGSELELVAWGLRNAFGLCFLPDGRLLATDQGADDRGSRPAGNVPDLLFEVRKGAWYGWPDFIGGDPITERQYRPERGPALSFLLANHYELPPPAYPLLRFPPHAAAVKFDVMPPDAGEWAGQIFVALFGDERPMTAPDGPRVGRAVARIDPSDWSFHPFLASPLVRPIDVRWNPVDGALYILDFGQYEVTGQRGVEAAANSGRLWRVGDKRP